MLCSFPSGPVLWWSFPPKKAFHWVTATSNFTTACVQGRQASESGVWCHLLDIWHFLSKPVWPFPLSWLPVGFLMGFVCPSSLRVFLLNSAPESTPIGMQLYSLFWWGSRSGGTTDAVPLTILAQAFVITLLCSMLFNYSALPLKSISNSELSLFPSAGF